MPPRYNATFLSDARSVALAGTAIGRFAQLCGFPPRAAADIRAAAGEALLQAAAHGERRGGFSVTCTCDENELCVEIASRSMDEDPSGFGTIIMRELMNSVSMTADGKKLRLVKRID